MRLFWDPPPHPCSSPDRHDLQTDTPTPHPPAAALWLPAASHAGGWGGGDGTGMRGARPSTYVAGVLGGQGAKGLVCT